MALAEIIREKKKLEAHLKSLKYYIDPNSNWKILYELLHTLSITYSVFALPVYVKETFALILSYMNLLGGLSSHTWMGSYFIGGIDTGRNDHVSHLPCENDTIF